MRTMDTTQRLHSLDNLRAAMMWLGIVLHVATQHLTGYSPLPWRDPATSPWADLLVAWIHTFRMPVFFIVAGFFVALLVQRRGLRGMLGHRFQRVALPFLVFWPPILLGMMLMVLLYLHRARTGLWGLDLTLRPALGDKPLVNTMHLWFLYQLWWFVVLTAAVGALATRLPAAWLDAPARVLRRLGGAWWGFLVLALPLAGVGAAYPHGIVAPQGSLLPPLAEWVHNGLFFAFGLALYGARAELLAWYTRHHVVLLLAGLPFFLASGALVNAAQRGVAIPQAEAWIALVYNAATWLWSFGLIGAFLRHLPQRNAVLGYLSESSYWVYLVHMLGTIGFGALVLAWPVAAGWKMLANIALTTVFALLSYQLLVRHTWVGRLLNGPRPAPPGGPPPAAQPARA